MNQDCPKLGKTSTRSSWKHSMVSLGPAERDQHPLTSRPLLVLTGLSWGHLRVQPPSLNGRTGVEGQQSAPVSSLSI